MDPMGWLFDVIFRGHFDPFGASKHIETHLSLRDSSALFLHVHLHCLWMLRNPLKWQEKSPCHFMPLCLCSKYIKIRQNCIKLWCDWSTKPASCISVWIATRFLSMFWTPEFWPDLLLFLLLLKPPLQFKSCRLTSRSATKQICKTNQTSKNDWFPLSDTLFHRHRRLEAKDRGQAIHGIPWPHPLPFVCALPNGLAVPV